MTRSVTPAALVVLTIMGVVDACTRTIRLVAAVLIDEACTATEVTGGAMLISVLVVCVSMVGKDINMAVAVMDVDNVVARVVGVLVVVVVVVMVVVGQRPSPGWQSGTSPWTGHTDPAPALVRVMLIILFEPVSH